MSLLINCILIDSRVHANPKQGVERDVSFESPAERDAALRFSFSPSHDASRSRFTLVSSYLRYRLFEGEGPVEEAAEAYI